MGCGVWGLGCGVWVVVLSVWCLVFCVLCLVFGVWGLGFGVHTHRPRGCRSSWNPPRNPLRAKNHQTFDDQNSSNSFSICQSPALSRPPPPLSHPAPHDFCFHCLVGQRSWDSHTEWESHQLPLLLSGSHEVTVVLVTPFGIP